MNKNPILEYLTKVLLQPSGIAGMVGLLTLLGVQISPEQSNLIEQIGLAVVSLIAALSEW